MDGGQRSSGRPHPSHIKDARVTLRCVCIVLHHLSLNGTDPVTTLLVISCAFATVTPVRRLAGFSGGRAA